MTPGWGPRATKAPFDVYGTQNASIVGRPGGHGLTDAPFDVYRTQNASIVGGPVFRAPPCPLALPSRPPTQPFAAGDRRGRGRAGCKRGRAPADASRLARGVRRPGQTGRASRLGGGVR